ncbi:MAG: LysE family transporter [Nitrospirae bacterium]|nr:LysE family transporter [Nitrospirota bacterium]
MEQNLGIFLISAVMISLSGVLSPGPMTAAAIQQGGKSGLTGMYIALGHGVVEMPLIILIFFGAGSFLKLEWMRILIGITGGIYLIYIGKNLLRFKNNEEISKNERITSSFYSGIILSLGNPYFLLWWGTIGVGLVFSASKFGLAGLLLFSLFHWLCDLMWYSFLSIASFKGIKMFGAGVYKKLSLFCGIAMFFYGGIFIVSSLKLLL